MNKAEAVALIKFYAAVENDPVLTDDEVELILSQAKRADSLDVSPVSALWTPTYDANYGIRMAWEAKAAKAAGLYTFLAGGNQFIRSDMIRHCQQMADRWMRSVFVCAPIGSSYSAAYFRLISAETTLALDTVENELEASEY